MRTSTKLLICSITMLLMGMKFIEIADTWTPIVAGSMLVICSILTFYLFDQQLAVDRLEKYKHDLWERGE